LNLNVFIPWFMKIQQLKYLCNLAEHGFNMTTTAQTLNTSQPGISKQMQLLELELGIELLNRSGNKILGLTDVGAEILIKAQDILFTTKQIHSISNEYINKKKGVLSIGTTHLHARYSLLKVINKFTQKYPGIQLNIFQGSPSQIEEQLITGKFDIGICTKSESFHNQLIYLKTYPIYRCLIAPKEHPLITKKELSLKDISQFPLIIYDSSLSSGSVILNAFQQHKISANIVLTATDAEVIKSYVNSGLGVAIIQEIAFDKKQDINLDKRSVDHLFSISNTNILINKSNYFRSHMYDFIELLDPKWTKVKIELQAQKSI
jgi:LysR family transcriptional regulator, cys regulon transcriptional activator